MLSQAALTTDHLPASQSNLISSLVSKWGRARDGGRVEEPLPTAPVLQFGQTANQPIQPAGLPNLDELSFPLTGEGLLPAWCNSLTFSEPLQNMAYPAQDPFAQDQDVLFTHEDLWYVDTVAHSADDRKSLFDSSNDMTDNNQGQ